MKIAIIGQSVSHGRTNIAHYISKNTVRIIQPPKKEMKITEKFLLSNLNRKTTLTVNLKPNGSLGHGSSENNKSLYSYTLKAIKDNAIIRGYSHCHNYITHTYRKPQMIGKIEVFKGKEYRIISKN